MVFSSLATEPVPSATLLSAQQWNQNQLQHCLYPARWHLPIGVGLEVLGATGGYNVANTFSILVTRVSRLVT